MFIKFNLYFLLKYLIVLIFLIFTNVYSHDVEKYAFLMPNVIPYRVSFPSYIYFDQIQSSFHLRKLLYQYNDSQKSPVFLKKSPISKGRKQIKSNFNKNFRLFIFYFLS